MDLSVVSLLNRLIPGQLTAGGSDKAPSIYFDKGVHDSRSRKRFIYDLLFRGDVKH
jgi:hypothetical protein